MRWYYLIILIFVCPIILSAQEQTNEVKLSGEPYIYTDWETFTVESTNGGLPNDHIFAIQADGNRLWIGTEGGLALYEDGQWKNWTEEDGLPWNVVTGIAIDQNTGDVWLALFGGGIARFSAGRFDHFHQLNSGLVNDVVYGIDIQGDYVWAATTAGTSRYNMVKDRWDIFTEKNAPMHEIWCYNVDASDDKVHLAVWGGGVLEWDIKTETWKAYLDPDGEMEIDLYRDDGIVHVITTAVDFADDVLWASTYFGLSRYDGRHWRGYMQHDSGLASSFINHVVAYGADESMCSTDKGLSILIDYPSDTWVTYQRETDECDHWSAKVMVGNETLETHSTNLNLPNHFVICAEYAGDDIWVGTGKGLARGIGNNIWKGLKQVVNSTAD